MFGLLVFVVGTLLIAHAWAVVDTKAAVTDAARQAAREYVEAPNGAVAGADAQGAADAAIAGSGRDPSRAQVTLVSGAWGRCERITISVSYPSAAVALPLVGRAGSAGRVVGRNSELVDPYRSGLPGVAVCR